MGMGGLQRGWLAAAASRARPLEGDEKVGSRGKVFGSGLMPSPTETVWLETPGATVRVRNMSCIINTVCLNC